MMKQGPLARWGPGQIAPVAPPCRRPCERGYLHWCQLYAT